MQYLKQHFHISKELLFKKQTAKSSEPRAANAAENPLDQSHDRRVKAGSMTFKNASVRECAVILETPKNHEDFISHLGFMDGFPSVFETSLICLSCPHLLKAL